MSKVLVVPVYQIITERDRYNAAFLICHQATSQKWHEMVIRVVSACQTSRLYRLEHGVFILVLLQDWTMHDALRFIRDSTKLVQRVVVDLISFEAHAEE